IDQVRSALTAAGYQSNLAQIHHDVLKLSNGHYILIGQVFQSVILAGDPSPETIAGDILIDLSPDLTVKWIWSSFDHLDVNRHPVAIGDWTHSNAVVLTGDGNLLLSMRHQSWILKIDYQNGTG